MSEGIEWGVSMNITTMSDKAVNHAVHLGMKVDVQISSDGTRDGVSATTGQKESPMRIAKW